jgi:hypothetical protein
MTDAKKEEQKLLLRTVEGYVETRDNTKKQTFTEAFSSLDPEYVLFHNNVDSLTVREAIELLNLARKYLSLGQFLKAIRTCYLGLALPETLFRDDAGRNTYDETRFLLQHLLDLTENSSDLVRNLPSPPTEQSRLRVLVRFLGTTNDKMLPKLVREELNQFTSSKELYARVISSQFKYVDQSNQARYHKCLMNYICLQFYLGLMPTHLALKHPRIHKKEDFATILKFFPENHVGRQIISNIRDALLHSNVDETYLYIGNVLQSYRIKKKGVLNEIKPATQSKVLKRMLMPRIHAIRDAERDLKYIGRVVESAVYERENNWPKRRSGSTLLRFKKHPYVDGNYTINVAVDVVLSKHDPSQLGKMNCAQKQIMAKDVFDSSWS